jgi:hypothetical protein
MPLSEGKSKKAFVKNLKTEIGAGKPMKQSLAIAYAMKKRAKKMADGGPVVDPDKFAAFKAGLNKADGGDVEPKPKPSPSPTTGYEAAGQALKTDKDNPGLKSIQAAFAGGGYLNGDESESGATAIHGEEASGYESMPEEHPVACVHCGAEDARKLGQHGAKETGPMGGGQGFHGESYKGNPGNEHDNYSDTEDGDGMDMLSEAEGYAKDDEVRNRGMFQDGGLINRVMAKRKMMSEGGKVANRDQGVSTESGDELLDLKGNEFDDLALRDDLESSYTGANSGDELGNDLEDEDRKDIVARILRSRAKRDKLPRPA